VIIEYFISTSHTLFIILEHMHMSISSTDADMYSIVTISYMYISYSDKAQCHTVFNGSGFFDRLDECDTVCVECYTEIYLVAKCEIDLPTMRTDSYSEAHG